MWDDFEPFSKRKKKREKIGTPDVYQYDDLPSAFRIQVIHIWRDALGTGMYDNGAGSINPAWQEIRKKLLRELALLTLTDHRGKSILDEIEYFFKRAGLDEALDVIDTTFYFISNLDQLSFQRHNIGITLKPNAAILELNRRFREHNIGYVFEDGEIMRIDSQYIHSEIVKPAISLLQGMNFRGAEDEFLKAHKHYRVGENKEAIVNALKAFESTMKAICKARRWSYNDNDTATKLIDIMFKEHLLPSTFESSFTGLRKFLEGLATVRNRTSAHGQGVEVVDVPQYLAAYALHSAASNIVFLVEAHKANISRDDFDLPF